MCVACNIRDGESINLVWIWKAVGNEGNKIIMDQVLASCALLWNSRFVLCS